MSCGEVSRHRPPHARILPALDELIADRENARPSAHDPLVEKYDLITKGVRLARREVERVFEGGSG